jgi:hypothetical protein
LYARSGLAVQECAALKPYRLFVVSSDERSWVDLRRGDRIWSTEQRVVYERDALALGHFPNVAGSRSAEWRLDGKGAPVAVIVRFNFVGSTQDAREGARVSRLLVIGLSKDAPCALGFAMTNEDARALADAPPKACPAPLPRL